MSTSYFMPTSDSGKADLLDHLASNLTHYKLDVQVFIWAFKNNKLRIMKFRFLRLFYVVSNNIKHNALIYIKLKLLLFNLKSTSYKNLNIE